MDLLVLLIVYCVIFVIGVLCMLYRDAPVLNSGPLGAVKQFIVEAFTYLIPSRLQNGLFNLCEYLLYTRNSTFQLTFLVLCLLGHAVWVVDMLPILYKHYPKHNHIFWPLFAIFLNFFCWHKAWTGDAGVINQRNVGNYSKIYQHDGMLYKKDKTCTTCNLPKPARSKHCSTCDRCVHRFDHHCIWTNNCVGGLNHRYFILFMATLQGVFLQGIYVGTGCLLDYAHDIRLFKASFIDDDNTVKAMTVSVAFQLLFMALPRLVFLVIALTVLFVLVGVFFCHHSYLVLTNQTTNERHKLQELQYQQAEDSTCTDACDKKDSNQSGANSLKKRHTSKKFTKDDFREGKIQCESPVPDFELTSYRPFSRGAVNNFLEVFMPHNFIMSRIKKS